MRTQTEGYLEADESCGDLLLPTAGSALACIETRYRPERTGVSPEVAHETVAGLNFDHAVAQEWDVGKLFHIDLSDQNAGHYDQDFHSGAHNPNAAFALVRFLEGVGCAGPLHWS